MRRPPLAAFLLACLALTGCTGADFVNLLAPRGGYDVERDIAYGEGERRRLDVYTPEGLSADAPVVIFFYGGNWQSGARDDYRFVGQAFASRGYLTVLPDYSLFPPARFPQFLRDAAAAVAWTRARYRGPVGARRPIFLVGHSAGAYIAAMLALDERWLDEAGASGAVSGAVGLAGPYDFLPLRDPALMQIFGPEEGRPATQPINYVDGDEPPLLLITGDADTTVRPGNSERLAARIAARGGEAETRVYEGVGHIKLVAAFASPLRGLAPVLDDIDAFIKRRARR